MSDMTDPGQLVGASDGSSAGNAAAIDAAAIDLGMFTVDELEALCPGRFDLLGGSAPDAAAGMRSLLARRRVELDASAASALAEALDAGDRIDDDDDVAVEDDTVDAESEAPSFTERSTTVIASFLSEPERTVLLRREDLFGTDDLALHGQRVQGEMCYVIEGGTQGVRHLMFSANPDAVSVVAELVGLHELPSTDVGDADPFEFAPASVGDTHPELAAALVAPVYLVTAGVATTDGRGEGLSFVLGEAGGWICEWLAPDRATARPLDPTQTRAALERLLG